MKQNRIVALTFRASAEETTRARRICDIVAPNIEVFNIPQHKPADVVQAGDLVLCFGDIVSLAVKQDTQGRVYELPNLKKLAPGNTDTRETTLARLKQLHEVASEAVVTPTDLSITEEEIDRELNHLRILEKLCEDEDTSCFHTVKGGKIVHIGRERNDKADLSITFEEAYTARLIMDILGVREVSIERNPKSGSV